MNVDEIEQLIKGTSFSIVGRELPHPIYKQDIKTLPEAKEALALIRQQKPDAAIRQELLF